MRRHRTARNGHASDHAVLISDNAPLVSVVQKLIGSQGTCSLLVAPSTDAAITSIKNIGAYCVLVDDTTEHCDGLGAIGRLRRELVWPALAIPAILLTQSATMGTIRSAVLAGADEVLSLPLTHKTLAGRMLACKIRPRPFFRTGSYVGPCRRRRGPNSSLEDNALRRGSDVGPGATRRLAREVHGHLLLYHAAQRATELLGPSMLQQGPEALAVAARDLHETSLLVNDARLERLSWICRDMASSYRAVQQDPSLLHGTLRDLIALVESRLNQVAARIQGAPRNHPGEAHGRRHSGASSQPREIAQAEPGFLL